MTDHPQYSPRNYDIFEYKNFSLYIDDPHGLIYSTKHGQYTKLSSVNAYDLFSFVIPDKATIRSYYSQLKGVSDSDCTEQFATPVIFYYYVYHGVSLSFLEQAIVDDASHRLRASLYAL